MAITIISGVSSKAASNIEACIMTYRKKRKKEEESEEESWRRRRKKKKKIEANNEGERKADMA